MTKSIPLFAILFMFTASAVAGTIVEIQDEGELTTIMTDGKKARMGMPSAEYVIVDFKSNSVKFVSPQEKQVMLMDSDGMPAGKDKVRVVKTSIKNLGAGPVIAGYKTQKFSYAANGKSCGTIYGSKDAYQAKGIKELFSAMKTMMERQRTMMGGFVNMIDDCDLADMNLSEKVTTIGVPMRTEKNGRVDSEVKSIKTGVSLPADAFSVPANYKTTTMQEQMKAMSGSMAGSKNQMQQQPQMQDMMKQMQQSGQITPEIMEQMREAQEMMNQYQR
ncbi:MAG: hypothetical protein ACC650_09005 [Gammaproteobacteria bacterium]